MATPFELLITALFALLGLVVGGLVNHLASVLPAFSVSRLRYQADMDQASADVESDRLRSAASADVGHASGAEPPTDKINVRPHCPHCGQDRPWWQWLSLPARLIGRGRCPTCQAPISLRHPLVEVGLAVTFGYLWLTLGPSMKLIPYLLYTAILTLILITDIERRLILNVVTYPAMLLAFVFSFFTPGITWWSALLGGAIGFTFFLGVALVGNNVFGSGAMGGGDVKLAAFVGLITGFPLIIEALLLTILIGAAVSSLLLITRVRSMRDYIPYGPFLVAGAMVTLLWGYPIATWFIYR